mgnify:CR=1 FL=1
MEATEVKEKEEKKVKRLNPVMECLAPLRGTIIINDPALML